MNLRYKVLIALSVSFIVIIMVLFAISSSYINSSYESLESVQVANNIVLVQDYLDSRISSVALLARDWGVWEDTYMFTTGRNPDFEEANLGPSILPNLQINFLVITGADGKPLVSTGRDLDTNAPIPVPDGLLDEVADPASPLRAALGGREVSGFYRLPEGPVILAAHPVLHSDNTGPPEGMVIMGRYIDDSLIGDIGSSSRHTVTISPISDSYQQSVGSETISGDLNDIQDGAILVVPVNDLYVEGKTTLQTIRGNEPLLLTVRLPRDIYMQGQSTIFSFVFIFAIIALIIGIIVIWLIDRLVLLRLNALHRDVDTLGRRGDLSARLQEGGNDEISFLTGAMNSTLDKLEKAQEHLKESEMSYRTLIGTIPEGIARTDLSGTIIFANSQMAGLCGHDSNTGILGRFLFDLIAPDDRDRAMKNLARTIREGQMKNIEYQGVRLNGEHYWLEMSVSLLKNLKNEPESLIVVCRDISRRKKWEAQLKESEERYRAVFENTGTATVIIEENTVISLANTEFERLSGYSRPEIEGKIQWTDFVAKDDLDRMLGYHLQRRQKSGSVMKKYEFRFVTRSGTTRDIFISIDLIPGTDSSIASLIDITDRKVAEKAIAESENRLAMIIDSSPIPQFVIDRNHCVIHWNRALENLTGIPAQTVIGTDRHWTAFYEQKRPCIADLIVDGVIENVPEYYTGKYEKGELLPDQYTVTDFFPRVGESGRWLFFTSTCIRDDEGNITGAIETLVDITGQKNDEVEIVRTNEQLTATLKELRATETMLKNNIRDLEEAKKKLQKSEARYRDIATNIPGIVFQFVVNGSDQYSVPFISERVLSMFTLGPDEIYSDPNALFNLIHRDDVEYAKTTLLDSARTMIPWNIEFRMKPRDGETRWFNGRAVPHVLDNHDIVWDGVLIDITERKHAEDALVASEQKFHAIFEQTFQFMGLMTPDGFLVQANLAALDFTGMKEADVIGKPFWETPWWNQSPGMQEQLKEAVGSVASGEFRRFEVTHQGTDGSIHYVDYSLKPVIDDNSAVLYLILEGRDVTEQRLLQERIANTLKEKELLLKEIHHRVKNNIQVIASLLSMQERTVEDPVTKEVLREARNRVKSIALVHEKLYQSKSLDRIDYRDYLQKISRHLYDSYGVSPRDVAMNIHAENISLHIDKAVPCSLIINELLSNAFKHAFPDGRKGDIWVEIRKNGSSITVQYRDNGVGLPENISIEQSESLGMRLLHGLTHQLHGTIGINRNDGTRITIIFPYDVVSEEPQ